MEEGNMGDEQWKYWCEILNVNSNVALSETNWVDLQNAFSALKLLAKDERYRSFVTENIVRQCKNCIEKSRALDFSKHCVIHVEAFRFLRNCCAGSRRNQNYVMSCGLLSTVMKTVDHSLKHNQESIHAESVVEVVASGIQILGNLVVKHEENQDIVWTQCYPVFFMKIMTCRHCEAKNYVCMVIYTCILEQLRTELSTSREGLSLVSEIVKMCCDNERNVEWGIFIIELLVQNGMFHQIYAGLCDNSQRLFLLELIECKLRGNHTPKFCMSWISLENALSISQLFEENIGKILNSEINFDLEESSSKVFLVSSLLRLLCLLSAFPEDYQDLHCRECLLQTTLVALLETSTEVNRRLFSGLSQFSNSNSDNVASSTHPAFGFKRSLIQLVANMCYHNRMNQDIVRQANCIPLLLDHCNIDDYNPCFIYLYNVMCSHYCLDMPYEDDACISGTDVCQWAIFCLRNVLENNVENQEVVKSLTKLGLAPNTHLAEAGFIVQETENNKIQIVGIQNQDTAS